MFLLSHHWKQLRFICQLNMQVLWYKCCYYTCMMECFQCKDEISEILTYTNTHPQSFSVYVLGIFSHGLSLFTLLPQGSLFLCVCWVACQLHTSLQTHPPSSAHEIHTHTRTSLSPIQLCGTLSKTSAQSPKQRVLKNIFQHAIFYTHPLTDYTALCTQTHILIFCGPTAEMMVWWWNGQKIKKMGLVNMNTPGRGSQEGALEGSGGAAEEIGCFEAPNVAFSFTSIIYLGLSLQFSVSSRIIGQLPAVIFAMTDVKTFLNRSCPCHHSRSTRLIEAERWPYPRQTFFSLPKMANLSFFLWKFYNSIF